MQPTTGEGTVTEKTWGQGLVVLKKKMAYISLISRVRTTAGTRQQKTKLLKNGKNSKKTTRRATSAIWRITIIICRAGQT